VAALEALSTLAEQYGVATADIMAMNGINDANALTAGEIILIPQPTSSPALLAAAAAAEQPVESSETAPAAEEEPATPPAEEAEATTEAATTEEEQAQATTEEDQTGEEGPAEDESADEAAAEASETSAQATAGGEDQAASSEPALTVNRTTGTLTVNRIDSEDGDSDDGGASGDTDAAMMTADASADGSSSTRHSQPSVATIREDFTAGYLSIGGSERVLEHILDWVIPCESSYNLHAFNPAGPFYGLMQFLEATWMRVGGGDWRDAEQQGANTARLLKSGAHPESQWPHCW
jgi:hypothetical protein